MPTRNLKNKAQFPTTDMASSYIAKYAILRNIKI
ncbi:hypothetical protein MCERHM31_00318 [Methylophilaceae bacterium]